MTVSSLSMSNSSRTVIQRLQLELAKAEKETGTLRHADVGLTLGGQTAATVSFRSQEASFKSQITSNKAVASNLELVDDSLTSLSKNAEAMKAALGSAIAIKDTKTLGTVIDQAKSSLEQMAGALNISFGGQSLFAGANTGAGVVFDQAGGRAAAKTNFDAFVAAAKAANGGGDVTVAQMNAYLENGALPSQDVDITVGNPFRFSSQTADNANWDANWSNASDTQMTVSIGDNETVTASLSANDTAFRKLASTYSMIASFDLAGLGQEARNAVLNKAVTELQAGIDGVTRIQADVGFRLGRIEAANERLTTRMDTATKSYGSLEDVDPAEVALRVNNLLTQLQATAEVTGRIRSLNILDYL
ncbi:flagellar hook-associated family protein [Antarcticirhabdus aurantiaca]|uniref:Flagellar hook-associated family protein n=1 Tax=Antarcticirhabdus aurantiaca TaxID=2606717 RepID=A0ACD4NSN9_9HYPH|nr:flagellar hook-associated family protein [Antarcticirhabdus aurantiaca]WAJ29980.1 flagellar hook-associated family protein [Jeongeuplla avenae]